MRVRLAFAAITTATLAVVACQPDGEPNPSPNQSAPCASEDDPGPCTWYADQQGNGEGLSFTVDASGNVRYWSPSGYESYHRSAIFGER